jgi:prolyl-tRNA synthetase
MEVATKLRDDLAGNGVRVKLDDRDQHRPGYKFSEWELKGVPVRVELGPRDVQAGEVVVADRVTAEKRSVSISEATTTMARILADVQAALFEDARTFREDNTHDIEDYQSFASGLDELGGFWIGAWCGGVECEEKVATETKASLRVLPLEREDPGAPCVVCGKPGTEKAIWARAY